MKKLGVNNNKGNQKSYAGMYKNNNSQKDQEELEELEELENAPDENAPDENAPDENAPDENTSDDNTSDDNASDDNAPDENTSDDRRFKVNTLALSLRSEPKDDASLVNNAVVHRGKEVQLIKIIDNKWGKFITSEGTGFMLLQHLLEV